MQMFRIATKTQKTFKGGFGIINSSAKFVVFTLKLI